VPVTERAFSCPVVGCTWTFDYQQQVNRHIRKEHPAEVPVFIQEKYISHQASYAGTVNKFTDDLATFLKQNKDVVPSAKVWGRDLDITRAGACGGNELLLLQSKTEHESVFGGGSGYFTQCMMDMPLADIVATTEEEIESITSLEIHDNDATLCVDYFDISDGELDEVKWICKTDKEKNRKFFFEVDEELDDPNYIPPTEEEFQEIQAAQDIERAQFEEKIAKEKITRQQERKKRNDARKNGELDDGILEEEDTSEEEISEDGDILDDDEDDDISEDLDVLEDEYQRNVMEEPEYKVEKVNQEEYNAAEVQPVEVEEEEYNVAEVKPVEVEEKEIRMRTAAEIENMSLSDWLRAHDACRNDPKPAPNPVAPKSTGAKLPAHQPPTPKPTAPKPPAPKPPFQYAHKPPVPKPPAPKLPIYKGRAPKAAKPPAMKPSESKMKYGDVVIEIDDDDDEPKHKNKKSKRK
jgi:hypothetical protein